MVYYQGCFSPWLEEYCTVGSRLQCIYTPGMNCFGPSSGEKWEYISLGIALFVHFMGKPCRLLFVFKRTYNIHFVNMYNASCTCTLIFPLFCGKIWVFVSVFCSLCCILKPETQIRPMLWFLKWTGFKMYTCILN